jgi:hypothetical protein
MSIDDTNGKKVRAALLAQAIRPMKLVDQIGASWNQVLEIAHL